MMAELVRVKDKFQVTLPARIRAMASIREGDYLEVAAVPEGILLRPRRIEGAERPSRSILDFLREPHGPGRTKAEIDAELDAERNRW
jgi:AbrB family looped-hinge helix DNA binding protein